MRLTEHGKAKVNGIDEYGRTIVGRITEFGRIVGIVAPTAEYLAASNIGQTVARTNGKISEDGGESCEARFRWRKKDYQTFFPIDPVEVTPGTINEWTDVDISGYVPVGATGALLHLVNNRVSSDDIGLRKKGSEDNRYQELRHNAHCWAAIGIDNNRIFEAYIETTSEDFQIWLVGYTTAGVTFFTNAYDKSLSDTFQWKDIDCHTEAPNAIGLIFEVVSSGTYSFGFRKKGSSDNRYEANLGHDAFTVIIGCDDSQVCQGYIGSTDLDFYLVGYITAGAVFNTNATDLSLETVDNWLDLASLPSNAVMAFIEVFNTPPSDNKYGLRKNGSSEDIYSDGIFYPWAFVECDNDKIIEGKIEDTGIDFFLVGYALTWTETEWQNTLETDDEYYEDLVDLEPGTEYEFQTQAKNSAGEGEWTASAYFTTLIGQPTMRRWGGSILPIGAQRIGKGW